jgi:hypothetical protein
MCPLDPLCYLPFQSYHMPPNVVALPPGTFYCSKDTAVKMKNGKPIPNCRKLGIGFPFSFFTAVSLIIMFRISGSGDLGDLGDLGEIGVPFFTAEFLRIYS